MRAMQYNRCGVLQQESVWCVLQSKKCDHLMGFISHLHSYVRAFCISSGIAVFVILPNPAKAEPPVLELPIDCQIGATCWLVNLVDSDPGPGRQDFRCGPMSYNTHRGTDIAIANKRVMAAGVAVLASAPGTVIGIRDGMPETTPEEMKSRTNIRGRECGNGVTIQHNDKWTTQYCHMKSGSVRVRRGDTVETGDRLGEVGLSGQTQFPHIHIAVRDGDTVIDPFTGRAQSYTCNPQSKAQGLWSASAAKALSYPGPQPFHLGFDDGKPDLGQIRSGKLTTRNFSTSSPALVFWAESYTLKKGDTIMLSLIGPDGKTVSQSKAVLDRAQARRYGFVGKKQPQGGWPAGVYTGRIEILRNGVLTSLDATTTVE